MSGSYDGLDIEVLQKKHLDKSMPILKGSVLRGNLSATLLLASELYSSQGTVKKNSIHSLAYYLAYNAVCAVAVSVSKI